MSNLPAHLQSFLDTFHNFTPAERHLLHPYLNNFDILGHLPLELAASVIERLDPLDPILLRRVSKRWHQVFTSTAVCSGSLLRDYPIDYQLWKSGDSALYQDKPAHWVLENAISRVDAMKKGKPAGSRALRVVGLPEGLDLEDSEIRGVFGVSQGFSLVVVFATPCDIIEVPVPSSRIWVLDLSSSTSTAIEVQLPPVPEEHQDRLGSEVFNPSQVVFGDTRLLIETDLGPFLLYDYLRQSFDVIMLEKVTEEPARCASHGHMFTIVYRGVTIILDTTDNTFRRMDLELDRDFRPAALISQTSQNTLTAISAIDTARVYGDMEILQWKEIDIRTGETLSSRQIKIPRTNHILYPGPMKLALQGFQNTKLQRLTILACDNWHSTTQTFFYALYVDRDNGETLYHRIYLESSDLQLTIYPWTLRRCGNRAYYLASASYGQEQHLRVVDAPFWTGRGTSESREGSCDRARLLSFPNTVLSRGGRDMAILPAGGSRPRDVWMCDRVDVGERFYLEYDEVLQPHRLVAWEFRGVHDCLEPAEMEVSVHYDYPESP